MVEGTGVVLALSAMIGFVVYSFINFVKFIGNKQYGSAALQAGVWGAGAAAVFLASLGSVVGHFTINGVALLDLNAADKIIFGIVASSVFATGFDKLLAAIDNSRSSAVSNPFSSLGASSPTGTRAATSAPSSTPGPSPSS